jgi:hypothetical protein
MSSVHTIPLLLSILVGLSLALVGWGFWRAQRLNSESNPTGARDDILLGLLVLAAFGLGIFLTYALLGLNF